MPTIKLTVKRKLLQEGQTFLLHVWKDSVNQTYKHNYSGIVHKTKQKIPCSGGSRISRRGGVDLVGGGVDSRGGYISKILYVETKESGPVGPPLDQHANALEI